ncbi:unnamed protein product, partial [Ostreobium quekettii]
PNRRRPIDPNPMAGELDAAPTPDAPPTAPADNPAAQGLPPPAASDAAKPMVIDNEEAVRAAQAAARAIHAKVGSRALTVRQYLEASVVPSLMGGMQALVRERPEDPVEYLAAYLLQHNPKKRPGCGGSPAPV